jgi:hypothetical protein
MPRALGLGAAIVRRAHQEGAREIGREALGVLAFVIRSSSNPDIPRFIAATMRFVTSSSATIISILILSKGVCVS